MAVWTIDKLGFGLGRGFAAIEAAFVGAPVLTDSATGNCKLIAGC